MQRLNHYALTLLVSISLLFSGGPAVGFAQADEVPMVPANFTQLAEKAKPGVVNIRTTRTIKGGGRVFRHFFRGTFRQPPQSV
jgi:serine protease Do